MYKTNNQPQYLYIGNVSHLSVRNVICHISTVQTESNLSEVCSDFYFRSKSLAQFNDIQVEPLKPNSMDRTDTQTSSLLDSALAVELTLIVVWKVCLLSSHVIG